MSSSNDTTVHLRVSVEASQGSRKSMEDYTSVTIEPRQDRECFFAVFDGHGGHQAAFFARQNLWKTIQKQKDFYSSDPDEVGKAIKRAFVEIHTAMWKERDSWPKTKYGTPSTAGTTASVVIMRGHHMFVANVGDSRVVLAQDAGEGLKAVPLTGDHKPEDPLEAQRIKSLGGQIGRSNGVFRVAWNRVSQIGRHRGPVLRSTKMESVPFLAIARSLGDLWSFNPLVGDFLVSPIPDVHYRLIDPRREKFVVLASDGLWNAMKNKEVVHFIDNIEKNVFDMDWKDDVTHRWVLRIHSIVKGFVKFIKKADDKEEKPLLTNQVSIFLSYHQIKLP
ncbi:phosphatase 1D-like [Paramuricea clavata]|uniref:Phosphatase 1D-like n=1 Tax=Paramuricea clavata TaxID=317549 RepID=A0A6S7K9V2_PARCT|nr:phosphatase 1D-like [Paramuricea clavata]